MSLSTRDPNGGQSSRLALGSHPIATGLASVVVIALVLLIALRHLFGSVRLEAGAR